MEVLRGIRQIKCYAWEALFADKARKCCHVLSRAPVARPCRLGGSCLLERQANCLVVATNQVTDQLCGAVRCTVAPAGCCCMASPAANPVHSPLGRCGRSEALSWRRSQCASTWMPSVCTFGELI